VKIGIRVCITIAIAALIVCVIPLKTVAYTVTVDYKDTETYYETEPYEVNTTEPLDYEVIENYTEIINVLYRDDEEFPGLEREVGFGDPAPKGYVVVKNTDDVAGTFNIKFLFSAWDEYMSGFEPIKNYQEGEVSLYIEPGESNVAVFLAYKLDASEDKKGGRIKEFFDFNTGKSVYIHYEPSGWSWEYEVTGTKTEHKQVEKQRTVTKQRSETRYKKVTLLDYSLHYRSCERLG
jgi:hypothetical protein